MGTNCKLAERLEFCKDLQNIIISGRNEGLTEAEILSRLETTIEVIKTVCECKIMLDK